MLEGRNSEEKRRIKKKQKTCFIVTRSNSEKADEGYLQRSMNLMILEVLRKEEL